MTRRGELRIGTLGGLPSMTLEPLHPGAPAVPPLVVLPGLSPEHAVPSGAMREAELGLMRPFAGPRRVVWLARRPGLPRGTTIADVAADLAEVLRTEAIAPGGGAPSTPARPAAPVDVLGVSTGGSLALQLAADHPDVVRRLVLVSSAARLGDDARAQQRRIAARARAGAAPIGEAAGRGQAAIARRRAFALLTSDIAPAGTLRAVLLAAAGWALGPLAYPAAGDLADLATLIEAEDRFDLRDRLGDVRAPALLVAGGRDRAYPAPLIEQTARGIPDARLVRFARRGHVTVGGDPRFAARVDRFLKQ